MTTEKKLWTWDQIWAELGEELEIADEDLVTEERARKYMNDGIDSAEAIINRTNQEYFLTYEPPIAFEAGIDAYNLPANIYASKIRDIIVNDGTRAYKATRYQDSRKFLEYRLARTQQSVSTGEDLGYFLVNESETGPRVMWTPVPEDTSWSYEYWYYRQANRLEDNEDICDIPEFIEYVFQWVRERVENRRRPGSPAHMTAVARLEKLEGDMIVTLQDMVIDGQDDIEQDMTHYEEHN